MKLEVAYRTNGNQREYFLGFPVSQDGGRNLFLFPVSLEKSAKQLERVGEFAGYFTALLGEGDQSDGRNLGIVSIAIEPYRLTVERAELFDFDRDRINIAVLRILWSLVRHWISIEWFNERPENLPFQIHLRVRNLDSTWSHVYTDLPDEYELEYDLTNESGFYFED